MDVFWAFLILLEINMPTDTKKQNQDTRVLIIEDEAQITRLIELELKYEGYDVITATDGAEGLKSIQQNNPDLVLLDCMLPNMTGEEVCQKVRETENPTPIIMITAKDGIEDKVKGLDFGADDYLVKPFATEELLARIRAVLRRKPKTRKRHAGVQRPLVRSI